jgi:hypothetical protein
VKEIKLTKGKVALVDDEDYDYLMQWSWCAIKGKHTYYAERGAYVEGKHRCFLMHREIMKTPKGEQVDHIDGNGLNCQKYNMRNCSNTQNCWNNKIRRSMWGYKGVYIRKENGTFRAYINVFKKRINLGTYATVEEAAHAYDKAAIKYFGEFANLNFPKEHSKIA